MRPFQIPTPQQFKDMADWLKAQGMSQAQAAQAIGTAAQGRTIGEIADQLRAYLKTLPKAQG